MVDPAALCVTIVAVSSVAFIVGVALTLGRKGGD